MTTESSTSAAPAGEYRVTTLRQGQGMDQYLTVVGPDGRSSDQKVYQSYSMTRFQVAEQAVAQHLGQEGWPLALPTHEDQDRGGCIVTVG